MGGDFAREANDRFAPFYDAFSSGYEYEKWVGRLLERAEKAGNFCGRRLLDLGCGTGQSFAPLLQAGWIVVACDVSPGMVAEARGRANGNATVVLADMRDLPETDELAGPFDLVWAVNDAINYLLSADELQAALEGIRSRLAPDGVALFDVNTFDTYRTFFAEEFRREAGDQSFKWSGRVDPQSVYPGMIAEGRVEACGEPESVRVHRQRHFPETVVRGAIQVAGLRPVEVFGELEGRLDDHLDENIHSKAVYLCKAAA